jgi:hypothetical protein
VAARRCGHKTMPRNNAIADTLKVTLVARKAWVIGTIPLAGAKTIAARGADDQGRSNVIESSQ